MKQVLVISRLFSFSLEFIGTFICGLVTTLVYNTSTCNGRLNLHIRIQTVTLATVACVLSAFYYTGGFYQPLLAFIRTFGLKYIIFLIHRLYTV